MNAAGAPPVRLELADGVAVATLDRPGKLNAFAGDMRERLVEVVRTVGANPDARVLVVTGAGRAFCSGGDVDFMRDLLARGAGYDELAPQVDAGREVVTALAALPIPVIAALNGVAAGAGANLALACDVRLASDEARFGETFVRIGLHPDWGGSWTLPRVVGLAKALDLCWSGEVIGADEMLRLGIVQRLWPAAAFEPEWRAYAARLAAGPRTSLRAIKASLRASAERTLAQALDAEAGAQRACWESGDAAEGLGAFREKREPRFVSAAAARARTTRFE